MSRSERVIAWLVRARVLAVFAIAVAGWCAANSMLSGAPDPFPFHWLQRVFIVASLVLLQLHARAMSNRLRREEAAAIGRETN